MISCAIIGATGLVGSTFLKVLEEKNLNIDEYYLFASKKSKGKKITFMNKEYIVEELTEDTPKHAFTYALFSAGSNISDKYAKEFNKYGTIVIDNSSRFRMDEDVPLVVPEINIKEAYDKPLIANPNCSTIQATVALNPLHKQYNIRRIVYSTYQAVSGAGASGINDLIETSLGKRPIKFPYKIYNNCIPHIDTFLENGYTKEEEKMINETKKILNDYTIDITATCVRVPVFNSHAESINVEFKNEFDIDNLKQLLAKSPGIAIIDDTKNNIYPLNTFATGKDDVFVGRIRKDFSLKNTINMWVVADNIRKGAASNAVQILEKLIERNATSFV